MGGQLRSYRDFFEFFIYFMHLNAKTKNDLTRYFFSCYTQFIYIQSQMTVGAGRAYSITFCVNAQAL